MANKLQILTVMILQIPFLPLAFMLCCANFTPCMWCQWKCDLRCLFKKGWEVEVEDETDIAGKSLEKIVKEMNIPIERKLR